MPRRKRYPKGRYPRRPPPLQKKRKARHIRRIPRQRRVPWLGSLSPGAEISLIVGLGNPGRRYRKTRHNAGLLAAELAVDYARLVDKGEWPLGSLALVRTDSIRFLVLLPDTFMNNSGEALAPVVAKYGIEPGKVVAIHDDIDIPLGDVRIKHGGGTAGHHGLISLAEALGDPGFSRIRIGVGRPPPGIDAADYVLSEFAEDERAQAEESVRTAAREALGLVSGETGE